MSPETGVLVIMLAILMVIAIRSIIDSNATTEDDSPSSPSQLYPVRIRGKLYLIWRDRANGCWYADRAGEVVAVSGHSRRELESWLAMPHRGCAHPAPPGFAPCTGDLGHDGPCALWPAPGLTFEDLFA